MSPAQINFEERNLPKSFHDDALNITYFYPPHFDPVAATADTANCVQTKLVANSSTAASPSSFVVSTIDARCPDMLREATLLGPFTRTQLLRD